MGNYTSTDLGIAIGPSLAGAFILMAAIIGAVVFFVKERRRRKECQESVSSSASLFREGRIIPHFRIPTFNHSPSPGNFRRDYHNTSAHLVQPWTAGNGKVFTIPVTPSDSSKTSTIDSQSDRSYVNVVQTKAMGTVTEKFYYDFNTTTSHTNHTSNNSNTSNNNIASTIPSTTTNTTSSSSSSDNSNPNQTTTATTITNNINPNQPTTTTTTTSTNTPAISSTTLESTSGDQVVMRRSREVSKVVKAENPIRSTILTEDAWNSTLDDIFNSALSLHEKGTQNNLVNVRGTVFPLMN